MSDDFEDRLAQLKPESSGSVSWKTFATGVLVGMAVVRWWNILQENNEKDVGRQAAERETKYGST